MCTDTSTITIPFIFRIKNHTNQSYPSIDKNRDRLTDIFNNGHISIQLDIRLHLKLENCVYGYEYNYNLFYLSNQSVPQEIRIVINLPIFLIRDMGTFLFS